MLRKSPLAGGFFYICRNPNLKKMKKLLLLISIPVIFISCGSQKVKGSRNVITEETRLKEFSSIEIEGDFEVSLEKGNEAMMKVTADDNLHNIIQAEISNNTLYIKPTTRIGSSKSQEIALLFTDNLERIILSDKVALVSLQDLFLEDAEVRLNDKAMAWLTVTAHDFKLYKSHKSKTELNLTAENAYFQLNGSSDLKALVNAPAVNIDTYEKASARIEGETENLQLRAEHSTNFNGRRLTAREARVSAEGNSRNQVEVIENLVITAKGRSKVDIYGNPKIEMLEFTETARISKKE